MYLLQFQCNLTISMLFVWSYSQQSNHNTEEEPAIAAMHGPYSQDRCGNSDRPFRYVPVNVLSRW